jgi:uncharacterized protein (DUF58 family)
MSRGHPKTCLQASRFSAMKNMFGRRRQGNPHVRFRLTMAGWAVFGASLMVAVVAVNSGLGLLMVLLGAMVGSLYVSAVLSWLMIAGVGVRRELPPRCRQNEPVRVGYKLSGARGGGACLALHVEELPLERLAVPPSACGHLRAHDSFLARSEAIAAHRGRLALRGVKLATAFPFGLVWARKVFSQPADLVVWPARGQLRRGLIGKGDAHSSSITPSARSGGADEFFGLREYRPGDSTRLIHWRRSAGRHMPVVREMSRPRPRTLWVLLDTLLDDAAGRDWDSRERALRLAGTIIEDALEAGYRVGAAWARTDRCVVISPGERRGQLHHLLDSLAEVDDNRRRGLAEAVTRLSPKWLHQADVMVVSPAEANESEILGLECLSRLRRESRNLTIITGLGMSEAFRDAPPRPATNPANSTDPAADPPGRGAKEAG